MGMVPESSLVLTMLWPPNMLTATATSTRSTAK
jgi:hypothetical protein